MNKLRIFIVKFFKAEKEKTEVSFSAVPVGQIKLLEQAIRNFELRKNGGQTSPIQK